MAPPKSISYTKSLISESEKKVVSRKASVMELIFSIDYSFFLQNMDSITDIYFSIKINMQGYERGGQLCKLRKHAAKVKEIQNSNS